MAILRILLLLSAAAFPAQKADLPLTHPSLVSWTDAILPQHIEMVTKVHERIGEALLNAGSAGFDAQSKKALADVKTVIAGENQPINPSTLIGKWKVRVLKIDRLGAYQYPFFEAEFKRGANGEIFFAKTSGSQRRSGYLLPQAIKSMVFLGGFTVNDEPQREYPTFTDLPQPEQPGSAWDSVGVLFRKSSKRLVLVLDVTPEKLEVYELQK